MKKVPKQQSVKIRPKTFHNDDPLNDNLGNTGKSLVTLQPTYPLHSVVYTISKANSSTLFNLFIFIKQSK